jgi:flavodoxin
MSTVMVVYDSAYGNTEQVAQAIGAALAGALGAPADVSTRRVGDMRPDQLSGVGLLVVGSPTQRFRPTAAVTNFLKGIPGGGLRGVKVAAFDTRLTEEQINSVRILGFFVKMFGYAAQPIADRLAKKGGELAGPPAGFYVADSEGPLLEGELERAAEWASQLLQQ